ncbi:DNA polymerase III subunit delta' [bacterium]|nr:DNA polymerase III subunit delta' [bacterium]
MELKGVYGHDSIKQHLLLAFQQNRVSSAYLFLGQEGIGKSLLVREFAQLINCETNNNCGQCTNCRMFAGGSHPDFEIIKPSGQNIRIKQIQDLIEKLSLKPSYATKRVILLKQTHLFNQESANSFLKILEEPPLDTLIILSATDENLLIETIVSRCQKIHFPLLTKTELRTILGEKFRLGHQDTEFVLNYAQGRIRKDFITDCTVLHNIRAQVFNMLLNLRNEQMVQYMEMIAQWVTKDHHLYFLEFCATWLRDFVFMKNQQIERVANQDMLNELKAVEITQTEEQLQWSFDLTIETELAIKANAAKQLALEALLIQIKQVFAGALVI